MVNDLEDLFNLNRRHLKIYINARKIFKIIIGFFSEEWHEFYKKPH